VLDLQMIGDDADDHRDQDEQQHLPAAREPERAAMRQLDEVVEEADRAAGERREEHRQALQGEVGGREERNRRREQDHQPAHRRRARLRGVVFGQILTDVLPELVLAEERNEARADED
jgi:hypothetical protein